MRLRNSNFTFASFAITNYQLCRTKTASCKLGLCEKLDFLAQRKSKMQLQEVCTVSSIVLLLLLVGHNMVFKNWCTRASFH